MPRQAVGKRVARAARTGGGRAAARRHTPVSWWMSMAVIVVLGITLVGWSRHQKFAALHSAENGTPPTLYDHWHAAFVFDICGTLEPILPQNPNVASAGLHTHGDGNIHVEPQGPADTGKNATLERFVKLYPGLELSASTVEYPGLPLYHNGEYCTSGPDKNKPGFVQIRVWNSPTASKSRLLRDPTKVKIGNGMLITIAFVPRNASIPKPPAEVISNLQQNMASAASGNKSMNLPTTVTTVPSQKAPSSTASTATTAPGSKAGTSPASTTPTTGAKTPTTTGKSSSGTP